MAEAEGEGRGPLDAGDGGARVRVEQGGQAEEEEGEEAGEEEGDETCGAAHRSHCAQFAALSTCEESSNQQTHLHTSSIAPW